MSKKYRLSYSPVFRDGNMYDPDIPRILVENIPSPFECVKQIRELFGEKCLPDQNLFDALPKEMYKLTFIMLGKNSCRCKLFIEMYDE